MGARSRNTSETSNLLNAKSQTRITSKPPVISGPQNPSRLKQSTSNIQVDPQFTQSKQFNQTASFSHDLDMLGMNHLATRTHVGAFGKKPSTASSNNFFPAGTPAIGGIGCQQLNMMNALGHKGSLVLGNSHRPVPRSNTREGFQATDLDGFNVHYFEESMHPDDNLHRIPIEANVDIDVPDHEKISLATVKHPKHSVSSTRQNGSGQPKQSPQTPPIQHSVRQQVSETAETHESGNPSEDPTAPCQTQAAESSADQKAADGPSPSRSSVQQQPIDPHSRQHDHDACERMPVAVHHEYGSIPDQKPLKHQHEYRFEQSQAADDSSDDEDVLLSAARAQQSTRIHRMNTPSVRDKAGAPPMSGAISSSRVRGSSASNISRATVSGKLGSTDWKHLPLDPPPLIIERAPMKRASQGAMGSQISGIFYFYQTVESTSLVEVLHKKKSEVVGSPTARVIYWKKTKSLVLDEGQLHKISLKDMKKSRFGVELSKVGFHGLKYYQTVIVKEKLYVVGGIRDHKASRSCFEIDLKNRTVFNIPNLPFDQMNQLLVAVDKSMFYCFGEIDPSADMEMMPAKHLMLPTGPVYGLFSYNTESRTWTTLSTLPSECSQSLKSTSNSASSRTVRASPNPESLRFSPSYMVSDKHFLFVVDRHNPQLVAKYSIAEDRWVKDLLKDKHNDLGRFDTVCMANGAKHTVVLGAAVSNTSDVDLVTLELLTNKVLKYTQLSVPDSLLPLVLVPLSKVRY